MSDFRRRACRTFYIPLVFLTMTAQAHALPSPIERFNLQSQVVLQGDLAARDTLSAGEGFEFPDLEGSRQSIAWLLQNELSARVEVEGAALPCHHTWC